jgi:aryl-alcohol dehydrogenase-like predicted oxidoreductase
MKYRLFGRSGLRVSELALGTMTFGNRKWGADETTAAAMYVAYRDAGGNFLDSANEVYSEGRSEEILGRLVADHRDEVAISTKYTFHVPGTKNANAAGNHRKSLRRSLEASLRRLGTDHVDILWLHCWDEITPQDEVLRALDDAVRQGKVLHIGVSNFPAWVVSRANMLAELRGWTAYAGIQVEYNLIERGAERELLPMSQALGLTVCAWSPLASGLLSGKYADGSADAKRLDVTPMKPVDERSLTIARGVGQLAAKMGQSSVAVALNWLRAKRGVIPLLGARTLDQLRANLACLEFSLNDEHVAKLDALSDFSPGYPHTFITRLRPMASGGFFDRIDR